MKKKFLNIIRAASMVLAAGALFVACGNDDTKPGPDGPDGPIIPDKPVVEPGEKVTESIVTPLTYYVEDYVAGESGVSVHVNTKTEGNIIFTLTPGEKVKSFRMNVFPLMSVYNVLLNEMTTAGSSSLTAQQGQDILFQLLREGTYKSWLFTTDASLGNETNKIAYVKDWDEIEFDWANEKYTNFNFIPDAEYIIAIEACTDVAGTEDDERSVVYAATTKLDLIGNPTVDLDLTIGYTSFYVNHILNSDAGFCNFFASQTADIQPFVDAYGEVRFMDFMRQFQNGSIENGSDYLLFQATGFEPGTEITTTALPLDINETPARKNFKRSDFKLKTLPTDIPDPEATLTLNLEKTSSLYIGVDVDFAPTCAQVVVGTYAKAIGEKLKEQVQDPAGRAAAIDAIYNMGWHVTNYKFTSDNTGHPTGDSHNKVYDFMLYETKQETLNDVKPGEEYILAYIACNAFGQAKDEVYFTDVVKPDLQTRDNPEACKANDVTMTVAPAPGSRGTINIEAKYNPEETACIYFQYFLPGPAPEYTPTHPNGTYLFPDKDIQPEERDRWCYWLLDYRNNDPFQTRWVNIAYPNANGTYAAGLTLCDPGVEYVFAYMPEDYNGVMGEIKYCKCTVPLAEGGPNPVVEITGQVSDDGKKVGFVFTSNNDMTHVRYMLGKDASTYLLNYLDNDPNELYSYNDFIEVWTNRLLASDGGMNATSLQTSLETETGQTVVALALPYGKNDVLGEMKHLIYKDGAFKQLSDFRTPPAKGTSRAVYLPTTTHRNGGPASEVKPYLQELPAAQVPADGTVRYMSLKQAAAEMTGRR